MAARSARTTGAVAAPRLPQGGSRRTGSCASLVRTASASLLVTARCASAPTRTTTHRSIKEWLHIVGAQHSLFRIKVVVVHFNTANAQIKQIANGARPTSHRLPTSPTSSAAEQRKIHKVKVEKAQENLKNSKEENYNKKKVSRKIKPGMEVGLRSPNSEDIVALGTVEEATGGDHTQVMINLVLNSTTKLPQAQGRMTILAHAQAHSVPWPKRNVTTEEIDKSWAEIVSSMDRGFKVHSRSDNKTPLTLEEIADIRADKARKKRRSLQEISEQISSQFA